MSSFSRPLLPAALLAILVVAGCSQPSAPAGASSAAKTVAVPQRATPDGAAHPADDHAGHDHAGHDHAEHEGHADGAAEGGMGEEAHDHHHPETLADLVAELEKIAAAVRGGMEENVREKADAPVHEFGHLLEDLPALAKEAKLPEEVEAAVVKAGEDLFDAFDKLDGAIHGSGDIQPAWAEQSARIEAGLKTLKDAVAK